MSKKFVAVGFDLPSGHVEHVPFEAKASLLDWDIILFRPDIYEYLTHDYSNSQFNGKLALSDAKSFQLKEACAHWRREIASATTAGKLVVVFLTEPKEVYVATGEIQTSGTGRNQKRTRIVDLISNYSSIPIAAKWTRSEGAAMSLLPSAREILSSYWKTFGPASRYYATWDKASKGTCLTTKHGGLPVGMLIPEESSGGAILLLPDIDFDDEEFFEDCAGESIVLTSKGKKFESNLLSEILSIAKAITGSATRTAEPPWAGSEQFLLAKEFDLQRQLLVIDTEIEEANRKRSALSDELAKASGLRGLLYETGKPLEAAIIAALHVLGFSATNYQDGASEFDAVFESGEGRLLGEAEGKDNKPVNIDKLRQLSTNIHEDLLRDEVTRPAKGILFGNGYRLVEPSARPQQFTEKCVTSSESMAIGLVQTSDLFLAVHYLTDNSDEVYARECRKTMVEGTGLIKLPSPPDKSLQDSSPVTTNSATR
ncbi:hypothetical protein [Neorhizobium alkalisoli]|uniref:hypothetical protein n=1 Tax=Neorhizobium alkalisoli TaxID=528178 RepID=UPI000CF872B3|nr:hypothetical protein [Neorhizobium alkalisoli]